MSNFLPHDNSDELRKACSVSVGRPQVGDAFDFSKPGGARSTFRRNQYRNGNAVTLAALASTILHASAFEAADAASHCCIWEIMIAKDACTGSWNSVLFLAALKPEMVIYDTPGPKV